MMSSGRLLKYTTQFYLAVKRIVYQDPRLYQNTNHIHFTRSDLRVSHLRGQLPGTQILLHSDFYTFSVDEVHLPRYLPLQLFWIYLTNTIHGDFPVNSQN